MINPFKWLQRTRKAGPFSAEAFVARAIIITIVYAVSRLAGLAEYTTFLSGTLPDPNLSWQAGSTLGMIHLVLHFAFVLLAPIFLIAAGLLAGWSRWRPEREESREAGGADQDPSQSA